MRRCSRLGLWVYLYLPGKNFDTPSACHHYRTQTTATTTTTARILLSRRISTLVAGPELVVLVKVRSHHLRGRRASPTRTAQIKEQAEDTVACIRVL